MVGFAWPAARYGVLLINQEMRCKVRIESLFCEPADYGGLACCCIRAYLRIFCMSGEG